MDEARSAPVRPHKKIAWEGDKQRYKHTSRLLDQLGPEGPVGEKIQKNLQGVIFSWCRSKMQNLAKIYIF